MLLSCTGYVEGVLSAVTDDAQDETGSQSQPGTAPATVDELVQPLSHCILVGMGRRLNVKSFTRESGDRPAT